MNTKRILPIISILIIAMSVNISAANTLPLEAFKRAEVALYGDVSKTAIMPKINTFELAIFGHKTKGSLTERAENIINYVFPEENNPSLSLIVPYMEKVLYNRVKTGGLVKRIENIELSIYGEIQQGAIITRVEQLSILLLPDEKDLIKGIHLKKGHQLQIKLIDEINTAHLEEGQLINFTVAEGLKVDGYLLVPAGTSGTLEITDYKEAGNFGKDASISVSINNILALDGKPLSLNIKLDDQENYSKEVAVGVSILGTAIISNPLGLIAGYFYKGKDIVIPADTIIQTQLIEDKDLTGIKVTG